MVTYEADFELEVVAIEKQSPFIQVVAQQELPYVANSLTFNVSPEDAKQLNVGSKILVHITVKEDDESSNV